MSKVCDFFNSSDGCQFGVDCRDLHIRESRQETRQEPTLEQQQQQQSRRRVVKKPIRKDLETKLEETVDLQQRSQLIREIELEKLLKRYPTARVTERGVYISLKPSDPDFAYDLDLLHITLNIGKYPSRRDDLKIEISNPEIPAKLKLQIQKKFSQQVSKTNLNIQGMLDWLDRNLEKLLVLEKVVQQMKTIKIVKPSGSEATVNDENNRLFYGIPKNIERVENNDDEIEQEPIKADNNVSTPSSCMAGRATISLQELNLMNIDLVEASCLSLTAKCQRCQTLVDVPDINPNTLVTKPCIKCTSPMAIKFAPALVHQANSTLANVELDQCTITNILASEYLATCTCSKQHTFTSLENPPHTCFYCHSKIIFTSTPKIINLSESKLNSFKPKITKQTNQCPHYDSKRLFKFPCCMKVLGCTKCHEDMNTDKHVMELAIIMICKSCSREQGVQSTCRYCKSVLVMKAKTGYWEGGKGTRSKTLMARNDPKKFAGMNKTTSVSAMKK